MLIKFIVDFANGTSTVVMVSCLESRPLVAALAVLRTKAQLPPRVDVRMPNGAPVKLWATPKQLAMSSGTELYVLVNGPSFRANPQQDVSDSSDADIARRRGNTTPLGKVYTFGNKTTNREEGNDEENVDVPQLLMPGLHKMMVDGRCRFHCRGKVAYGGCILQEKALVSIAYPMQLVELVSRNEVLRALPPALNAPTIASSLTGVSDDDFSRWVSVAQTFGIVVETKDRYRTALAFYPQLQHVPHGCAPTACFVANTQKAPYEADLVCVVPNELEAGDEVTYLYPKVDRVDFVLLPEDRRQSVMQLQYNTTCSCLRCRLSGGFDKERSEVEATITGAFYQTVDEGDTTRKRTVAQKMRADFEALGIMDETSGMMKLDPHLHSKLEKLTEFLQSYTTQDASPLQLHRHHWRASYARLALLHHYAASNSSVKADLDVLNFMLQQIATEQAIVPPGHPLWLHSYRSFYQPIMRSLPPSVAAVFQRQSRDFPGIDWQLMLQAEQTIAMSGKKLQPQ